MYCVWTMVVLYPDVQQMKRQLRFLLKKQLLMIQVVTDDSYVGD